MHRLLPSQTTGKAVTTKMNTDMMIPQDITQILDQDVHSRTIHISKIEPSTINPHLGSTQANPLHIGYQPQPEGKENPTYKPIHHRHTNQVIMNSIPHGNPRNIVDNADNFVHNAYCKKEKTRETSGLSNRTSQPRLPGYLSLRQAL